jgi:hypothetical protein
MSCWSYGRTEANGSLRVLADQRRRDHEQEVEVSNWLAAKQMLILIGSSTK